MVAAVLNSITESLDLVNLPDNLFYKCNSVTSKAVNIHCKGEKEPHRPRSVARELIPCRPLSWQE